jgi:hypothetical protein
MKTTQMVSPVWPQNWWLGFLSLGLKTDNFDLVIWASKLTCQFIGLGLKTKQALVCWLCHKTNEGRTVCDTR